ncbi:DUF2461 domain-containing protein [Luteimonas sp. MC1572]|uniref:DUF2461 domain-containing protein n=1 Tax=Luteimonas sp. MC1572 TaxID=2799325 RepID=UPI0018F09C3C|nr:DUF2461 domain-containing protein [Luteimonas sp. MC1572]MBJ6980665.1 DUF2461 domain-containing protein [Luteimonas sp. MC1572]QQO02041.1 DUF2461 domain-containing protein [Luteimonas sp. MC1572]
MASYFSDKSLRFLRNLARHNERTWFQANKHVYEAEVRDPFRRLLVDLQPDLLTVSAHYRAEPRAVDGSLFRIQRDTRFANDKSPYKGWQGARLFHARSRETAAPSFYLHLQPGNSFIGAGLWHPETATLRRIRQFIVDNPGSWEAAAHAPAFKRRFALEEEDMLVRPPRGFPDDFPFLDDLRHKNFVASRAIDDATMTGPRLRSVLAKDLQALAPFVDYLCASLDLEF